MNKQSQNEDSNKVQRRRRRRVIGDFNDSIPLNDPSSRAVTEKTLGFSRAADGQLKQSDIGYVAQNNQATSEANTQTYDSLTRRQKRALKSVQKRQNKQKRSPWRLVRRFALVSTLALFLIVGFVGIRSWLAFQQVIDRGGEGAVALQGTLDPSQLQSEGEGRVNILLIGIGGDQHDGGDLADSITFASIDPASNDLALLTIPRDLYVTVPGFYDTRINAAHSLGATESNPYGGIDLLTTTIEEVLDIPVHYYVRADFEGFVDIVDTVGGIDVQLDTRVYDPNFDWEFGYGALDLPAGLNRLDGQTALLLARARGASGIGIGVDRGDFSRGIHQQRILVALKDKLLSTSTITNPARISSIIDSIGDHVRTNLQVGDMVQLYEIINNIPNESISSYSFNDDTDNYLASATINGASVLVPKAGDFSAMQEFVRTYFTDGYIKNESASIDVYNASNSDEAAVTLSDQLATYGYTISTVANTTANRYDGVSIYDFSNGQRPYTKRLLEQRFSTVSLPSRDLPDEIFTNADFVIVIGNDATETY